MEPNIEEALTTKAYAEKRSGIAFFLKKLKQYVSQCPREAYLLRLLIRPTLQSSIDEHRR